MTLRVILLSTSSGERLTSSEGTGGGVRGGTGVDVGVEVVSTGGLSRAVKTNNGGGIKLRSTINFQGYFDKSTG